MNKFQNRREAGKILASQLQKYAKNKDVLVLALPRGGVPVAYEIANALSAPLDILIVRKLGVPGHEELAMGAVASEKNIIFNQAILQQLSISKNAIDQVIALEQQELKRRAQIYRGKKPFPDFKNKIIILVDDGIATGATMRAAIQSVRQHSPKRLVLAVPVAAADTLTEIAHLVDEIICPLKPENFYAVGAWYDDFPQTSDEEVFRLLNSSNG